MSDQYEKQALLNIEAKLEGNSTVLLALKSEAGRLRAEDEVKGLRSRVAKGEELLANWRKRSAEAEERAERAEAQIRPKCPQCNSVGLSHCAHPEDCGGVYYPTAYVEREVAKEKDHALNNIAHRCGAWADKTFTKATPNSICEHLRREIAELIDAPTDAEEAADCMLLLFHLAHKQGWNLEQAVIDKFEKNQGRKWGNPDSKGVVEHVKESVQILTPKEGDNG